jgi:pantoate--beta-alanine ligase
VSAVQIVKTVAALHEALTNGERRTANGERRSGAMRVGFVPTMGFLHEGHASLIRRARAECDVVVVSIFVNPTQFGPGEDFAAYPRDLDRDLTVLAREGGDIAFVPEVAELYGGGADTFVVPGAVASTLEGASRPTHFRGVATVVTILFNAVRPHVAYFGEKDWQQLQVVRHLVRDLQLQVEIASVPTMREADGLAMSSRNSRLSKDARVAARCMPRALEAARAAFALGETRTAAIAGAIVDAIAKEPAAELDYAVVVDAETLAPSTSATASSRVLIAAWIGGVRLIDNTALARVY